MVLRLLHQRAQTTPPQVACVSVFVISSSFAPSVKSVPGGEQSVVPPLAEALLTDEGFCGEETPLSLRLWVLVSQPHSSGRPHTHEYMGGTNQTRAI